MAEKVKEWITINGQHIPIMEGQTKQEAVDKAIKHQQSSKQDADIKERQIAANKQQADEKNDRLESRTKSALHYALAKGEGLSFPELVEDTKYEFNLNSKELDVFENKLKMAAIEKGRFSKYHEDWKREWKRQGFDYDRETQARDLSKMSQAKRNAEDLIPKDSYTNNVAYQQAQKYIQEHFEDKQKLDREWLDTYKQLEQAEDKHTDPKLVKELGRAQARMFVYDEDYPDTAELRQKVDKIHAQKKELEEQFDSNKRLMESYDAKEAEKQRYSYGRPSFEKASGTYPGFKTDESTVPMVDRALKEGRAKVVEMSPEQYIHECAHYIFQNSTIQKTLRSRVGDKDTEKYAAMMRQGVKFDTPYINYESEGQEGLHRAVAAYMNGIDKIPVIIIGRRR